MIEFGVNLKRFDVSKEYGGICPADDPAVWIRQVISELVSSGLGKISGVRLRLFLPESLLIPAQERLCDFAGEERSSLSIGSECIYRSNVSKGGNFGAFTSNLPASAVRSMNLDTALVGHSEERLDKFQQIENYDPEITAGGEKNAKANSCINRLIGQEVGQAVKAGLSVMVCVGETAEERGEGAFEEQQGRIETVLKAQLQACLEGMNGKDIVIAYEPRWAIGPGKTPPGADYIAFVSDFIKKESESICGSALPVVYGGGLKRENSASIGAVKSIDGGLVALTKFTDPIGFDVSELGVIIDLFLQGKS